MSEKKQIYSEVNGFLLVTRVAGQLHTQLKQHQVPAEKFLTERTMLCSIGKVVFPDYK